MEGMEARRRALSALISHHRGGAYADAALKEALARDELDARDAAFATELFYRTVEMGRYIDWQLAAVSSVKLKKIHPAVLEILRLGACQIFFLNSVPQSAAVNTSVALAKERHMGSSAGFVNALLRRICADGPRPVTAEGAEGMAITYSHPTWLVELFISRFGEEAARAILAADNEAPPVTVRLNPLRGTEEELSRLLASRGAELRLCPDLPLWGELISPGRVDALPEWQEGRFTVQDASGVMAVTAAAPKAGMRVLDLCAAPGGKTFCAAALMEGRGEILSCDIHPHKVEILRREAVRLGAGCVTAQERDAAVFDPALEAGFDLVIADVPCSGLGVIRKKPDLREKDPESFAEIEALQRKIARNAARYVRPGGTLLYSTCTLREEENEQVRAMLLSEDPGLSPVPFRVNDRVASDEGEITLRPDLHGCDGFYFAIFRKRG